MKAQKTIKVSDRVHESATKIAERLGVSKALLLDLLLRKADEGELAISITAKNGVAIGRDNNGSVALKSIGGDWKEDPNVLEHDEYCSVIGTLGEWMQTAGLGRVKKIFAVATREGYDGQQPRTPTAMKKKLAMRQKRRAKTKKKYVF